MARSKISGRKAALTAEDKTEVTVEKADPKVKTKRKRRGPTVKRPPLESDAAYTVENFCLLHGISIQLFYKLQKAGLAPAIMKLGTRTLITRESAAAWRAARTKAQA